MKKQSKTILFITLTLALGLIMTGCTSQPAVEEPVVSETTD